MLDAIRRACGLFHDQESWRTLQRNLMNYDCSWARSVEEYWGIYRSL